MMKSDRRTPGQAARRTAAAELQALHRDAVPAELKPLLAKRRGREYYEGLLAGYAHAPRVAELLEFAASNESGGRWRPLELRCHECRVVIDGNAQKLAPADFAFYAVMVRRRLDARGFVTWHAEGFAEEYLREYRRLADGLNGNRERLEARLDRHGVERQWFEERKCRVNHAVRALGGGTGRDYGIVSRGRRPNTRSGVIVAPGRIRIRGGTRDDAG